VCGWLAETRGWHWGFAAAGFGMALGLIQFQLTRRWIGDAGLKRGNEAPFHISERIMLWGGIPVVAVALVLCLAGAIRLNPVFLAQSMAYVILALAVFFFVYAFFFCGLDKTDKERVGMILVLFLTSAIFWSGFEQMGSSFNLFAERYTARYLGWFHFEIPTAWFQALGPVFIIAFAPVFAWLWVWLARKNLDPSIPVKFALGLFFLAAGFVVMAGAARVVIAGHKAWPTWLIMTYLLHTFGELCLSPVGLSSVTKLAPRKLAGQMMGIWFLATALGNLLAGLLAGEFDPNVVQHWPVLYLKIVILPAIAGILLIFLARPLKSLMTGIK
jgi:proton-dependent oligopeptide transporter, POT family